MTIAGALAGIGAGLYYPLRCIRVEPAGVHSASGHRF